MQKNFPTSVPTVNRLPETYRFHFLSQNGLLAASTIYFEGRNPAYGVNQKKFLGSLEFIQSENQETCFELVYLNEKRKIDEFAGFIEEPDEDFPYEFSTIFTSGGVEYSNYHLVDQQAAGLHLFHVTLLSGFSSEDIQLIRQFSQSIVFGGIASGLSDGDVLEIQFEGDSIRDRVGLFMYLN